MSRLRVLLCLVLVVAGAAGVSAKPYPFVLVVPPEMKRYFTTILPPREVPYEVKKNHWSGTGTFRVSIDSTGRVMSVGIVKSTGYRGLDETLATAVLTWRARPGKKREIDFPLTVQPPPRGMPGPGL
jgi:TonB family protein